MHYLMFSGFMSIALRMTFPHAIHPESNARPAIVMIVAVSSMLFCVTGSVFLIRFRISSFAFL